MLHFSFQNTPRDVRRFTSLKFFKLGTPDTCMLWVPTYVLITSYRGFLFINIKK
jgi:hypothetical protein